MKYVLVLTIENNKGYLKFDNHEAISEFFKLWKVWFKQGNSSTITIKFMTYCEYKKKKHAGDIND